MGQASDGLKRARGRSLLSSADSCDDELAAEIDDVCDRFEQMWRSGNVPDIGQFVDSRRGEKGADFGLLATELAIVDMEYRWREADRVNSSVETLPHGESSGTLSARPSAADYVPLLSKTADLDASPPVALIAAEYRCRRLWGEGAGIDHFLATYGELPGLSEALCSVVEELDQLDPSAKADDEKRLGGSRGLEVRCPHCRSPMRVVVDEDLTNIPCTACGSHFNLVSGAGESSGAAGVSRIGHFELIERLGMGGYGAVWKARDTQLDRIVAVKIPRREQLSPEETEQFLREARAAAQLKHPHIVAVHEVGIENGTLYLVSDLIRGVSLADRLTNGQPMSGREAAQLASQISRALHHAHTSGVIHRDIKPANVMLDERGEPHLMDFGLAKRQTGEVTVTVEGQILGTPAYMSPEQARGEGQNADARSDVYSVGALLFELMTGELPFRGNVRMMLHQVLNDEPPQPRSLNRDISLDLETICLKCLEKEPQRRYASAAALADDLDRSVRGEPIAARPIGVWSRRWRWCQRNPAVASLTAAAAILLASVAIVATIGYVNTSRALEQKAQAAATSEQVSLFLQDLFESSDPFGFAGGEYFEFSRRQEGAAQVTARELLDRGAERIRAELAGQPAIQAELMEIIGGVYRSLGLYKSSSELLKNAVDILQQIAPDDRVRIAAVRNNLAWSLHFDGRYQEAERLYRTTLDEQRELLGADHLDVTSTEQNLALLLITLQEFDETELLLRHVIRTRRTILGDEHQGVAIALAVLAAKQLAAGETEDAQGTIAEALIIFASHGQGDLPFAGHAIADYQQGMAALGEEQFAEAAEKLQKSAEILTRILGDGHPFVAWVESDYAKALEGLGRFDDAIATVERVVQVAERIVRPMHPKMIDERRTLAALYYNVGRRVEAERLLNEVMRDMLQVHGADSWQYAMCLKDLAVLHRDREQWRDAEDAARRGLQIVEQSAQSPRRILWDFRSELARALIQKKDFENAIATIERPLPWETKTSPNAVDANTKVDVVELGTSEAIELLRIAYRGAGRDDADKKSPP